VQAKRPEVNAVITHVAIRVVIAPRAVNDNGYIAPFLSMNPAVGLENLLAEPVCADLNPRPRRMSFTRGPQDGLQALGSLA
jgi:hypothetical protein